MAEERQRQRRGGGVKGSARRHKRQPPEPSAPGGGGGWWFALAGLTVWAAAFPVAASRIMNDESVTGAFFAPLAVWTAVWALAWAWSRPRVFAGDRGFVALTTLLLGLGVVVQLRLGTWEESWTAWRAYAPLVVGAAGFLFGVRWLPAGALSAALPRVRWLAWLGALGVMGVLLAFGRSYRGGTFLPGQINPTELAKLLLVCFAAGWLPARREGLSRTVCGLPTPPLRDAAALAFAWGAAILGAVAVRDLGLALILCLTLVLMLTALTRRPGWLALGAVAAVAAGWAVRLVSAHTRARFDVWLDPFADPLGKGWQIGQSLCAQYAGGMWGTGLGEGTPGAVPIVSSDFVYAAMAAEWGWAGCALLRALLWLWLLRLARAAAAQRDPTLALLGAGVASALGAQILLNVGGVTKALPMTGITLPLFSQGGFSLMTTLLLCALGTAATKPLRAGARPGGRAIMKGRKER